MIFIGGVHGVGKSYICNIISQQTGLKIYSASHLISEYKKKEFSKHKKVSEINKNQDILIEAFRQLNEQDCLLDGHFCLLNETSQITRIPLSTFSGLTPQKIILLFDNPTAIADRLFKRDGILHDVKFIEEFQKQEVEHCNEVVETMNISHYIYDCSSDIKNLIDFLQDA